MACTNLFKKSGVPQKNITMVDRTGVIFKGRKIWISGNQVMLSKLKTGH